MTSTSCLIPWIPSMAAERPRYDRPDWANVALGKEGCAACDGLGTVSLHFGKTRLCPCAARAVFRACYARYRELRVKQGASCGAVRLEFGGAKNLRGKYGRKHEEYLADFELVARRHLDAGGWLVFETFFLRDGHWRWCCEQTGLSRGNFFHEVYRIERLMGRVYADLEPYPLWPLGEYFSGMVRAAL